MSKFNVYYFIKQIIFNHKLIDYVDNYDYDKNILI